ncbi:MAG: ATP-binding protein [Clostridiales bacterium]|nr:ATP-binding protein [Clostridiales bacterium]
MQLVILSGKGGTGKTTIVSSFAYLADQSTIKVDCDVDASNLHLMFNGKDISSSQFSGSKKAIIDSDKCIGCGLCEKACRFDAIIPKDGYYEVMEHRCEGCNACRVVCPADAITLEEEDSGKKIMTVLEDESYLSRASLYPGADGSGKLVSEIRKASLELNKGKNNLIIIDGSPGVGCSVMASITGVEFGLLVTEPTQSGFEDFVRAYELAKHFRIKSYVAINKYDLNEEMADTIERYCDDNGIKVIGRIPYDVVVNKSNFESKPLVMYNDSIAGNEIKNMWNIIKNEMEV